jgi:hypothetical protein
VQLEQLGGVESRSLHNLNLANVNVVEGVDSLASFLKNQIGNWKILDLIK